MEQTPPVPEMRDLAYETYYLSYVQADHALALLKTLGYTTVEYNDQNGESLFDKIYNPLKLGNGQPPIIVKLIDSARTSFQQPAPTATATPGVPQPIQQSPIAGQVGIGGTGSAGVPEIGGSYLAGVTTGDPQERLLILYDKNDTEALQSLINLLENTIDVPSRQIMIEALVIEINANRMRQLGVNFETVQNSVDIASAGTDSVTGAPLSIFTFTKGAPRVASFNAQLNALLTTGQAQILSNPSVLVLDDRQARIQIGQQVPVAQQLTNVNGVATGFTYFPVGIVLNLRPRISDDSSEVTMQTETIVSAIDKAASSQIAGTSAFSAPVIDNREVQSFVRVADNTPFIIGGLIATNDTTSLTGIPLLSEIPWFGGLFRSTTVSKTKQEVIIVITPHVVPLEDKYFSYVIPKDSGEFDRLNFNLFRNAYRIKGSDLFDLEFVYDSNVYTQLVKRVEAATATDPGMGKEEPFSSVLGGRAPGEDVLVRRMLWEIIRKTKYYEYVDPTKIFFFKNDPSAPGAAGFRPDYLSQELLQLKGGQNALSLTFDAQPKGTAEQPLVPPKALVDFQSVGPKDYPDALINGNARNPDGTPRDWKILIGQYKDFAKVQAQVGLRITPLEYLQSIIVLKRLLELNKDLPLTLNEFQAGRQIIFPSQEELKGRYHFVDRDVAKLFYEVYNYYPVFEQEFNQQARAINDQLDKISQK
jgi:general secretion pathway protein D